jgi:hypothetical protein
MTLTLRVWLALPVALGMIGGASARGQQNPDLSDLLAKFRSTTVSWRLFRTFVRCCTIRESRAPGTRCLWRT